MSVASAGSMGGTSVEASGSGRPGWWLVTSKELTDLWLGGRAMTLLILFSLLMGVMSFLMATNSELQLIPANEALFLMLQIAVAAGLFIGLIIGADTISGERERATLEGLLLTPTSRRQIVLGKYLGAISLWPAVFVVASVYLAALTPGTTVLGELLIWGVVLGTLLVATFTALGVLVSIGSSSPRSSISVSLFIYFLFLVPTQLPGAAQSGTVGEFVKWVAPIGAVSEFLARMVVNNRTLDEMAIWLASPIVAAIVVLVLLFGYAAPRLRMDSGNARTILPLWGRISGAAFMMICLETAVAATPTMALQGGRSAPMVAPLRISVDLDHNIVKTGDQFDFNTVVTADGREGSPPLTVAMNIVNLKADGDPVDPEDWSPLRAQPVRELAPGESDQQNWTIYSILPGDYLIYMVVIPEPAGSTSTSQPVASSGIHLTVTPYARINPGGVLPFVLGTPALLGLGALLLSRHRRQGIDLGGD